MKRLSILIFCILIIPLCVSGQSIKQTVHFEFNKSNLLTQQTVLLDTLVNLIKIGNIKAERIEITAHCDSIGSMKYNDTLSERRAASVKNYLIVKGINSELIKKEEGKGKRFPLNNNTDSLERYLNRRAEIVLYYSEEKKNDFLENDPSENKNDSSENDISKLEVNSTMVLKNMNFYPGRHQVLPQSEPVLLQLLKTLKDSPSLHIEIQGYVCCLGPGEKDGLDYETGAWNLSENRAKEIYNYLVKQGIDSKRLSWKGFGGKFRLVREITEEDRTKNRRVEIKVTAK